MSKKYSGQGSARSRGTRQIVPGRRREDGDLPPKRTHLDGAIAHTIDHAGGKKGHATRVENTLARGQLGEMRRANQPVRKDVVIRSEILAVRDGLTGLPIDDAIVLVLEGFVSLGQRRAVTVEDRMATIYLLAEVLAPLDATDRQPYMDMIAEAVKTDPETLAKHMADLLAQGRLIEGNEPHEPARATAPVRPPHWRDALDGIGKIKTYWAEQERQGTAATTLLHYGNGWSSVGRSEAELLAGKGMTPAQGQRAKDAVRALIAGSCRTMLPFYVAPPIGALLAESARTIPPTTLTPQLLPTPSGMFWFGEAVDWLAVADEHERDRFVFSAADVLKATDAADHLTDKGTAQERAALLRHGTLDTKPRLRAMVWHPVVSRLRAEDGFSERLMLSCYFQHTIPPGYPIVMESFGHELSITIGHGEIVNPDRQETIAQSPDGYAAPGAIFVLSLFAATLIFLRQEIVRPETTRVENKGARKSLTNTLKREPPEVQIIRLRQYAEPEQDQDAVAHAVEWSCSWLVRGHWHRYRTGKGRVNLEPRYVAPFVKGDRSKPIRVKQKIGVLSR